MRKKSTTRSALGLRARARTIPLKSITRLELKQGATMNPPTDDERPRTRGECAGQARPCPWVGCRHHLYLDINPETGSIKMNFPDVEPWELAESCSLDVAEDGENTLENVGLILNITRERVRQLEGMALHAMEDAAVEFKAVDDDTLTGFAHPES